MYDSNRKAVITGIGCISPIGRNKVFSLEKLRNKKPGFVLENIFRISPVEWEALNKIVSTGEPSIDLAVISFLDAIQDAGLTIDEIPDNAFLSFSSSKGGLSSLLNASLNYSDDIYKSIINFLPVSPLNHICKLIGKNLPSTNSVSACSTGLYSIFQALWAIQRGSELAISGTTESSLILPVINAFNNMGVLTKSSCKPFDTLRDGFNIGEGAACFIIEEETRAKYRNAKIYAEISGYGICTDVSHITALNKNGDSIAYAIKSALKNKIPDWINAHGTATKLNDLAEYNAFKSVFNNRLNQIPVNSFKPYTGHLLGASSAVETALLLWCMSENFVPANINLASPEFDLLLPKEVIKKEIRSVLKLSYGFGGHIGAAFFEKS